ncbi:protein TRACHEARY ELEMENT DIFFERENTIATION-RELATED 7A-like [Penaeus japonicus]|uniref:protein TRACHEARY ELEMENT DIFFERENTIATION-RELATED 7A-like n=1 Tax=Penaeus japonicus TaxID=27405 RepID=UPI001C710439|nr:protein TRACHEARY ELEMENT DIFFERENTIATION-RELATED 7A-like [Penaeus japonicus]
MPSKRSFITIPHSIFHNHSTPPQSSSTTTPPHQNPLPQPLHPTTILFHNHSTPPESSSTTTPPHQNPLPQPLHPTTILFHNHSTPPQSSSTTAPPHHNPLPQPLHPTTILFHNHSTPPQPLHPTTILFHNRSTPPQSSSTTTPPHQNPLPQPLHPTTILFHNHPPQLTTYRLHSLNRSPVNQLPGRPDHNYEWEPSQYVYTEIYPFPMLTKGMTKTFTKDNFYKTRPRWPIGIIVDANKGWKDSLNDYKFMAPLGEAYRCMTTVRDFQVTQISKHLDSFPTSSFLNGLETKTLKYGFSVMSPT